MQGHILSNAGDPPTWLVYHKLYMLQHQLACKYLSPLVWNHQCPNGWKNFWKKTSKKLYLQEDTYSFFHPQDVDGFIQEERDICLWIRMERRHDISCACKRRLQPPFLLSVMPSVALKRRRNCKGWVVLREKSLWITRKREEGDQQCQEQQQ